MPGDIVVVTKLDRLGRFELLELIDRISKAGASFRSVGEAVLGYVQYTSGTQPQAGHAEGVKFRPEA
jgi:DNA invertase Pin-like site-specific DNA recombinase